MAELHRGSAIFYIDKYRRCSPSFIMRFGKNFAKSMIIYIEKNRKNHKMAELHRGSAIFYIDKYRQPI